MQILFKKLSKKASPPGFVSTLSNRTICLELDRPRASMRD